MRDTCERGRVTFVNKVDICEQVRVTFSNYIAVSVFGSTCQVNRQALNKIALQKLNLSLFAGKMHLFDTNPDPHENDNYKLHYPSACIHFHFYAILNWFARSPHMNCPLCKCSQSVLVSGRINTYFYSKGFYALV